MLSLFLRNLFFTILQPGLVAGLIPYWIIKPKIKNTFTLPLNWYRYAGVIVFVTGFIIMINCIATFAIKGRGTLSPADPTKHLVATGLYKFSRNPMYIGVMLILTGEAIFFKYADLWIYALLVFIAFNAFIILHEEPRLKRDFGNGYKNYCRKVRRWI
jgi:protein-S-isoprenylcysteine O-methyltransferase Ste14